MIAGPLATAPPVAVLAYRDGLSAASDEPRLLEDHTVARRVMLTPAMCGHNSLFLAQVADWTWSAVSAACGTELYRETNEDGARTVLSFVYLRIRGGPGLQMHQFTFGDVIDVATTVCNAGGDSILTTHRISRASGEGGSLYVEALNRWIARSRPGNDALVRSSPAGIDIRRLPVLPDRDSPRVMIDAARKAETFHDFASPDYEPVVEEYVVDYTIDAARDLNGIGLVFFASFASILDSGLLRLWKHLGRNVPSFMNRVVLDRRICFTANAEVDATLRLTFRSWRRRDDPREEIFNIVIRDPARDRLVVVSTLQLDQSRA